MNFKKAFLTGALVLSGLVANVTNAFASNKADMSKDVERESPRVEVQKYTSASSETKANGTNEATVYSTFEESVGGQSYHMEKFSKDGVQKVNVVLVGDEYVGEVTTIQPAKPVKRQAVSMKTFEFLDAVNHMMEKPTTDVTTKMVDNSQKTAQAPSVN